MMALSLTRTIPLPPGLEENKRQVTKQEGEDYAKAHNLSFIEISAKEEADVAHLFQLMKNLLSQ